MLRHSFWSPQRFDARLTALFAVAIFALAPTSFADSRGARASGFQQPVNAYSRIRLSVVVVDRNQRPVAGISLHYNVDLDGQAVTPTGETAPDIRHVEGNAVSNANGVASLEIDPASQSAAVPRTRWFRGDVHAVVEPVGDAELGIAPLDPGGLRIDEELPLANDFEASPPAIAIFERPDRIVDGFPIWSADGGADSRIVVVLEGFDLYNRISATDTIRLISGAADAIRRRGISLLVVNYPDSHVSPDKLAPLARNAIETAARISGRKVALVGLSMGGIVGRWALCEAEAAGKPLPVNSFLMLDTPNRGANLNTKLQAMTLRYGLKSDSDALESAAARALLTEVPGEITWKRLGYGREASRMIPIEVVPDAHFHEDFYRRLESLNDHRGYPKTCRVVAIANSSRHTKKDSDPLLYMWLPLGVSWLLPSSSADHAPGSTLPPFYCDRFRVADPFGIAGAYLRSAPTFVANTSALDSDPGQTPPFDAWYAREDNLPPLPHDEPSRGATLFAVREILAAAW